MKESKKNVDDFSEFTLTEALTYNRFQHYLISTKKYKHLFYGKGALFSFVISIFITFAMHVIAKNNYGIAIEKSEDLILVFISGLLTVLALSLTGLAIVTSTISDEVIDKIIEKNRLLNIISIFFNFYFAGFLIGSTIFLLTISYILINLPYTFSHTLFVVFVFFNSYLIFLSIIYSVMLLGTSIRVFLIKYAINNQIKFKK